jgi:DNA-binding SARP family transcriptional activator
MLGIGVVDGKTSDSGSEQKLQIQLIDGFGLKFPEGRTLKITNRKACALLAYLCLSPTNFETRERLAGLLWSERQEHQARASLRQCLKQLRSVFDEAGFCGFESDRSGVYLTRSELQIDILEIEFALQNGLVTNDLISLISKTDRVLYGFENLDQSFATWLHVVRENWRDRFTRILQNAMDSTSGDESTKAAQALVGLDPTHETANRHVIRGLAKAGNVPGALKQYRALWELLDEEFDMEPATETQLLIAEVKSGEFEESHQSTPALTQSDQEARPLLHKDQPILRIREFEKGGPWRRADYYIVGFRRELMAALVRFREWSVTESNESTNGSGAAGQQENDDYLLEGAFFEDQDGKAIVVLTLKNTETHQYVWSERLEISQENWAQAQQQTIQRISLAMNVYLSAEKVASQIRHPGASVEAHDLWLKGQDRMLLWRPESENEAESLFTEIIRKTPGFAPAYSGLAAISNARHFIEPGMMRDRERSERAYRNAQKSVALDPLDTRNQLALAWANAMLDRFDQAEIYFSLAHELNPNNPSTLVPCAHGLSYCGKHEQARGLVNKAIDINPEMPAYQWGYVMCVRYLDGNFSGAAEAGEVAGDRIFDLIGWRAAALAQAGDQQGAKFAAEKFIEQVRSKWVGQIPAEPENFVSWFLHCFPIRNKKDRVTLKEGLRKAGLPVVA